MEKANLSSYAYVVLLGIAIALDANAQKHAIPIPVNCAVTNSYPTPFTTPVVRPVDSLPNSALTLFAPIDVSGGSPTASIFIDTTMGENNQGDWATRNIQINTNPPLAEVLRLSSPFDLLAGEALTDATFVYPGAPVTINNPSVVFQVPIALKGTFVCVSGREPTCGS